MSRKSATRWFTKLHYHTRKRVSPSFVPSLSLSSPSSLLLFSFSFFNKINNHLFDRLTISFFSFSSENINESINGIYLNYTLNDSLHHILNSLFYVLYNSLRIPFKRQRETRFLIFSMPVSFSLFFFFLMHTVLRAQENIIPRFRKIVTRNLTRDFIFTRVCVKEMALQGDRL